MKTGLERIGTILSVALLAAILAVALHIARKPPPPPLPEKAQKEQQGILHYRACKDENGKPADCNTRESIPCFVGDAYAHFLNVESAPRRFTLAAKADLDTGEKLEIYRSQADNGFLGFVIGPDRSGAQEACEVSSGKNLSWTDNAPNPAAAVPAPVAQAPAEAPAPASAATATPAPETPRPPADQATPAPSAPPAPQTAPAKP
jgi:hypothetical protein